eukprot:CAMPEP_0198309746 /NCGR_PEP_ID=MMETSP1450-20131203/2031_1 /TAXON_ID=753684 ORGANISM="Madagascaria erythrocladiodes, Strain CCMP3234" /NCGR_SAMPLE_ID=MMETSP1450 /ASSEMBLY_ACC=CAM_ASM_001115 /LENGTH=249 /DNA_ID=CAMNT_0044012519 /DNA_START=78 /DNA_END=827 /DNA_ORIENTATION=+
MASLLSGITHARQEAHFRDRQLESFRKLRASMTPEELARHAAKSTPSHPPASVDQLSEILAHSHIDAPLRGPAEPPPRPRLPPAAKRYAPWEAAGGGEWVLGVPPGGTWMKDVNVAYNKVYKERFSAFEELAQSASTAVGKGKSVRMAEGALVGIEAFMLATAGVAMVGIVGLAYLATNPWVVDGWREGTRRFAARLDGSLGEAIRKRVGTVDSMVEGEESERVRMARQVARGVAGWDRPSYRPPRDDS